MVMILWSPPGDKQTLEQANTSHRGHAMECWLKQSQVLPSLHRLALCLTK